MNPLLWAAGGGIIFGLACFGYAQIERADRIGARAELAASARLLKSNQEALNRLIEERAATVGALEQVTASMRATTENLREARSVVNASPRTNSCVALPGVRALRDSLRTRGAGSPGSSPVPAR